MSKVHRQVDTWVLDLYLNDAGWDGQHQIEYFSTKRDAVAVENALIERGQVVTDQEGDYLLETRVYQISPYGSFFNDDTERDRVIRHIGDGLFADIEYEKENA